jgi:hypothetical protein
MHLPAETGNENGHGIDASFASPETQMLCSKNPVNRDICVEDQEVQLDEEAKNDIMK